jgi:archaellum biogenesis ATPase FlaH
MQSRAVITNLFTRPLRHPSVSFIESCHKRLMADGSLLRSLGLEAEVLKSFRIGLLIRDGRQYLVIPYRDGSGNYESLRLVSPDGKESSWEGFPEIPFWVNRSLVSVSSVFVVSNELDAVKLSSSGLQNVVAIPSPCLPFGSAGELFNRAKAVYLISSSREEVLKKYDLALRIGLEKTFSLLVSENLSREFVESALPRAMHYNVRNVLTLDEALSLMVRKNDYRDGMLTPWKSLNEKVDFLRPGQLVVVSSDPKIGKTTLCLNIAHYLVKRGYPVLFYCLEMGPEELAEMLLRMEYGISGELGSDVIKKAREELSALPFLFAREHAGFEDILITVRESVKLYGVKVLFFDNLQFLLSDIDNWGNEASMISKRFKILSTELNILVFLVVQARKRDERKPMMKYDIRDSSTIPADADQIWRLFRSPLMISSDEISDLAYSPRLIISVEGRFIGGGQCCLYFDGKTKRVREFEEKELREDFYED